jgi:hypothetical protein
MTLSDRLQEAKTRRLIEAGVLPSDHPVKPEPEAAPEPVEDEPQGLFEPITIEVKPTGLHLVTPAAAVDLTDMPTGPMTASCPNCNSVGRLDMVDLVGHTRHYTCLRCGMMWQMRSPVDETVKR